MKKKMSLRKLSVQSFVTDLKVNDTETAKGGVPPLTGGPIMITPLCTTFDFTRGDCDMPTIGHDDGSFCVSKEANWCNGR